MKGKKMEEGNFMEKEVIRRTGECEGLSTASL